VILQKLQEGFEAGAWLVGFVCALAIGACIVLFLWAIIMMAFGNDEEELEEGEVEALVTAEDTDATAADGRLSADDGAGVRGHHQRDTGRRVVG